MKDKKGTIQKQNKINLIRLSNTISNYSHLSKETKVAENSNFEIVFLNIIERSFLEIPFLSFTIYKATPQLISV